MQSVAGRGLWTLLWVLSGVHVASTLFFAGVAPLWALSRCLPVYDRRTREGTCAVRSRGLDDALAHNVMNVSCERTNQPCNRLTALFCSGSYV